MLARHERQEFKAGPACVWRALCRSLSGLRDAEKIEAAQKRTKGVPHRADQQAFGVPDYWSTPREFMAGGGDCEDMAIARYMLLRSAGIEYGRVKMVVVIDQPLRQFHALTACLAGDQILFLDGKNGGAIEQALPAAYKPLYMVDEREWTIFVS